MFHFTGDLAPSKVTWAEIDAMCKENGHNDAFIMKLQAFEKVQNTSCTLILNDKSFFAMLHDTSIPSKRRDLSVLHSVVSDASDPRAFFMYLYKTSLHKKTAEAFGGMKIQVGGVSLLDYTICLDKRHFICTNKEECEQWVLLANIQMRQVWQATLEAAIIPPPEIYQAHFPVIKVNRKLKAQDRVLVLSDSWMYNIEPNRGEDGCSVSPKEMRWAFPISTISVVRLTRSKEKLDLGPGATLYFDEDAAKKILKNEHIAAHVGSKGQKNE